MRPFLLSAALLAAVALAALAPAKASAQGQDVYYYRPYSYGVYYAPGYMTPVPYDYTGAYGPRYRGFFNEPMNNSGLPPHIVNPDISEFSPIYSGPGYFNNYAPNRLWVYPSR